MSVTGPQLLYMILILPTLFGLALIGEGTNKVIHEEWYGLISVLFGMIFIGVVILIFIFFSAGTN
ncbi:MAG: hypothetical protein UV74_C0002G0081 [Candidatus Woesebacteria bacterium GW2011_GWB1_43_14]|uniref:Uncharacterized protein n=1 Tax=Candidatus Woesebacteria bacterium GW2011_GWB1_43_14 TaxID=1618578 RepID=A0A0G1DLW0_9BACT|nr:MAG: hypothetical protein UV51_C0004G0030 [Candidatus Woesebacteria bacterium GW2011_GWC1_42_9]KKS98860.1 MAG: hypothetical protein UV74_C0002G0081 [Candidatus Woesebacteria bacterium GW2011_GWB1_43_14]